MARITRTTTQFDNVALPHDLSEKYIDWNRDDFGYSATLVGSQLYLLGASRRESAVDTVSEEDLLCLDLSNANGNFKSEWKGIGTPTLSSHRAFLDKDCLVVFMTRNKCLWKLDLITMLWFCPETQSSQVPRSPGHVAEYIEASRELIFFGGKEEYGMKSHALSVDSMSWRVLQTTGKPPLSVFAQASCSVRRRYETTVYLFGGGRGDVLYNDLHALHCAGHQYRWSKVGMNAAISPVAFPSITYLSEMLFIYGGLEDAETSSQLFRYDFMDGNCTDLSHRHSPRRAEAAHSTLVVQDNIIVIGGVEAVPIDIRVLRAGALQGE